MKFLAKHVLVNAGVTLVAKYGTIGLERILAKHYPEYHEQYVQTITDAWDAKISAFIKRNADLVDVSTSEDGESVDYQKIAEEQIKNLFSKITKGFNEKGN